MATELSARCFTAQLTIERLLVKDVLRAVLHSVLFHRVLGVIKPASVEVFNLTFPTVSDPTIDRLIDTKIDEFTRSLTATSASQSTSSSKPKVYEGTIAIVFLEKRTKKTWFQKSEEEVPWEQWKVEVRVENQAGKTERERLQLEKLTRSQLSDIQSRLIDFIDLEKEHIPPITNADVNPFPMQILIKPPGETLRWEGRPT